MRFSERFGFKPVRTAIQKDDLDQETRNRLWNILHIFIWNDIRFTDPYNKKNYQTFTWGLWHNFYQKPVDTIPDLHEGVAQFRREFLTGEMHGVFDFLEYTLAFFENSDIVEAINYTLESSLVGHRYIDSQFTDITDEQEVTLVQKALAQDDFPYVREHLRRALELLSDRKNPDYRNSIKESISAVESIAKHITQLPKAELGPALKELEKKGRLHPALKTAFLALYGYTSNENGIRHGLMDVSNLTADDAKYFFLSCTSFVNYLKTRLA